jgi:hypothetical protein
MNPALCRGWLQPYLPTHKPAARIIPLPPRSRTNLKNIQREQSERRLINPKASEKHHGFHCHLGPRSCMDSNPFSRDRLLLTCESNQKPFEIWPLRLRLFKTPRAAIPEPDHENNRVPAGFPKSIISPTAWTGADFANGLGRQRYTLTLNDAQITELEQACNNFKGAFIWFA